MDVLSAGERDRILQAMADCCAEQGFGETSIEEVMERAGVKRQDFDEHFADKEDCALVALNKTVSETLAAVATASPRGSEAERRAAQIAAITELIGSIPSFAHLSCIEARQAGTPRMRDRYESAGAVLALMMERARTGGYRPPAAAARAALGGAEAVVRRELVAGRGGGLRRLLPDFVYAALVPFVGQREALRQSRLARQLIAEEE